MKYAYLNSLGMLIVLIVNYMANGLPINGLTTGEVSQLYPNLFVPAGITFSIWGVIYLFLLGFCSYPFITKDPKPIEQIGIYFFLSCLLNASWIFVWHYLYIELSVIIMLALLAVLIIIYKRTQAIQFSSKIGKWLVRKPFSLYLGWISVATIANITALLVSLDVNVPSPAYWAVAMIFATQLLVLIINKKYKDIAYSLVIIWALSGIIIKQSQDHGYDAIVYTCIAGIIFTALNALYNRYKNSIT